jgi:L-ascorbate metabolism protein UlaG (beta-lactamase superfamily)
MYDFGEEDAVLLMDNYSHHLAPAVLTLLSNARVPIVAFDQHTT